MMPVGTRTITRRGGSPPLSPRDLQIIELVSRFRIMTGEQLRAAVFPSQVSGTPCDRALKRLTDSGHLVRLARLVGGFGGGSGCYVYQLGRVGWRGLGKGATYRPLRVADLHTLTITECFVMLERLARRGEVTVITYQPEPVCHVTVGGIGLTPDAYVELGSRLHSLKFLYWLEIDRDTENSDTIKGKCIRYWRAYKACGDEVFPYVIFVVPDSRRAKEIERVVARGPDEAQALFQVYQLESFAEVMHRNMR